ncbi:MFS transporter [Peterkaempfera bronchialis]|uniref:MFS transporter n=1 Tax=Peterkaempfera bronchialis TaxID=2126346 RepID=UPI003C2E8E8A
MSGETAVGARRRPLGDLRALPPLARLLISTQLAFNLGFYAVLPYLAGHLGGGLGMTGWLVGLVLGLRTFSQQGMFAVGGALTDRFGPRPVVLAGCGLRIAGFLWLGTARATWAVVAAVLLVGFAAALFSPAVESELARQAVRYEKAGHAPRTRVLGLFSAAGQLGAFAGPLLGSLLLPLGFRAACLAGAGVFVLVLAGHWRLMPGGHPGRAVGDAERGRAGGSLGGLLRNRRFMALALAYSSYLLAYNELYLALPQEVARATGSQAPLAWLFALSSLLVVAAQLPVSRWAAARLSPRGSVAGGLLLVAAGFAVVAVALPAGWRGVPGLGPAAGLVVLLTVGQMLVVPSVRAWVPELCDDRRLGLYTGALSSVSGLVVLVGSALTGRLLDLWGNGPLPWLVLAALPMAGAVLVPRRTGS